MAGCIKMPLGMEVGLNQGNTVLDGDPASPRGTAHFPEFSAHVCCGQMARWIKIAHGREVFLDAGDIVLDGNPVPPISGAQPPIFDPCLLWPNGWMDKDATW